VLFFEGKVLTSRVGERAVGMFARVDLSKKSTGLLVFLAVRSQFSSKMMRYLYRTLIADLYSSPRSSRDEKETKISDPRHAVGMPRW
jgi:hypothetical protein